MVTWRCSQEATHLEDLGEGLAVTQLPAGGLHQAQLFLALRQGEGMGVGRWGVGESARLRRWGKKWGSGCQALQQGTAGTQGTARTTPPPHARPQEPHQPLNCTTHPPLPTHLGLGAGIRTGEDEALDALPQPRDVLDLHKVALHSAQPLHVGQAPGREEKQRRGKFDIVLTIQCHVWPGMPGVTICR